MCADLLLGYQMMSVTGIYLMVLLNQEVCVL